LGQTCQLVVKRIEKGGCSVYVLSAFTELKYKRRHGSRMQLLVFETLRLTRCLAVHHSRANLWLK
jgi:hypothetical protein